MGLIKWRGKERTSAELGNNPEFRTELDKSIQLLQGALDASNTPEKMIRRVIRRQLYLVIGKLRSAGVSWATLTYALTEFHGYTNIDDLIAWMRTMWDYEKGTK